ncbi:hypothetical protein Dimus_028195 [Dionaea muscipula]
MHPCTRRQKGRRGSATFSFTRPARVIHPTDQPDVLARCGQLYAAPCSHPLLRAAFRCSAQSLATLSAASIGSMAHAGRRRNSSTAFRRPGCGHRALPMTVVTSPPTAVGRTALPYRDEPLYGHSSSPMAIGATWMISPDHLTTNHPGHLTTLTAVGPPLRL